MSVAADGVLPEGHGARSEFARFLPSRLHRAAEKDIHPKRAAAAFDVTPETMLRYYTATEKKKTADEVLMGLAEDLLPKSRDEEE